MSTTHPPRDPEDPDQLGRDLGWVRASRYRRLVLTALHGADDGHTAIGIADRHTVGAQQVCRAIDELVERGLVTSDSGSAGGRGCLYVCTDRGAAIAPHLGEGDSR